MDSGPGHCLAFCPHGTQGPHLPKATIAIFHHSAWCPSGSRGGGLGPEPPSFFSSRFPRFCSRRGDLRCSTSDNATTFRDQRGASLSCCSECSNLNRARAQLVSRPSQKTNDPDSALELALSFDRVCRQSSGASARWRRTEFRSVREQLWEPRDVGANRLATTQIELINVITDLCATIQSTEHDDWTRGRVQARQELLQGYWEDFMSNHLELMEPDNDDPSYDRASNYALVQGQYVDATGVLYDVQSRLQSEPRRPERVMAHLEAPASAQSHSRLPQINVPDFSGRREDWESFRDLFNALIHQSSHLSNVERLYYLKTLVRGDARSALDSLQLTGDNYDTAWKLLESRYENRRLLVHEHLLALRSLKPLREPSAKAFQQLIDTLSRHRDQLRTLKCPVDTWDAWFISIAASCMDPITRQAWEADLERNDAENGVDRAARKGDHLASFDDLSTFLNSRCRMAVACSSGAATTTRQSTSSSDHRPARAYATRQGRQDCVRCGSEHYVGHCDAFASMNSAERRELVMQQRLCFNCLRPGHAVRACPSRSTCQTCGATHHTLLHEGSRKRAASSHEPGGRLLRPARHPLRHSRTLPQGAWHRRRAVRRAVLTNCAADRAALTISAPDGRPLRVRTLLDACSEVYP
ncbi:unnamed protein product [Trichogramma brassicae]|uniref:CCHC-type domain-containing protein n=1 Tax=Trichogramma brassicae TaxID=86971 RepID=A0A6H5J4T2_9HYME|nr:unnamed protein product [Trichogramma brassicae]